MNATWSQRRIFECWTMWYVKLRVDFEKLNRVVAGDGERGMLLTAHLTQHTHEDKKRKNLTYSWTLLVTVCRYSVLFAILLCYFSDPFWVPSVYRRWSTKVRCITGLQPTSYRCRPVWFFNVSLSEFLVAEFLCFCVKLLVDFSVSVNRTFWDWTSFLFENSRFHILAQRLGYSIGFSWLSVVHPLSNRIKHQIRPRQLFRHFHPSLLLKMFL
jgi:hypothetical protein